MHFKETDNGFEWGAARVVRYANHEGKIFLGVETPKGRIEVYVTKTGKIRVHSQGVEWLPKETV